MRPARGRSRKIRLARQSLERRYPRTASILCASPISTQTGRFARLDQGKASLPHHRTQQPPRHRKDREAPDSTVDRVCPHP